MAVVESTVGFSGGTKDDLDATNNLVRLSEVDMVSDELGEAGRHGPSNASNTADAADERAIAPSCSTTLGPMPRSGWDGEIGAEQTLGQLITETRQRRGLSREQVTGDTHIPANYVRMIESDTYDDIPDELYLLPFIRRYAIFLGLDSQEIVSRFVHDFEKAENAVVAGSAPRVTRAAARIPRRLILAALVAAVLFINVGWRIATEPATDRHPVGAAAAADQTPKSMTRPATAKVEASDAPPIITPPRAPDPVAAAALDAGSTQEVEHQRPKSKHRRRDHRDHLSRHPSRRTRIARHVPA